MRIVFDMLPPADRRFNLALSQLNDFTASKAALVPIIQAMKIEQATTVIGRVNQVVEGDTVNVDANLPSPDEHVEDAEIFMIRPGARDQKFVKKKGVWTTGTSVKPRARVQPLTSDIGGKAYPKDACIWCGRSGHFARECKHEVDINEAHVEP